MKHTEENSYLDVRYVDHKSNVDYLSKFIGSIVSTHDKVGGHSKDIVLKLIKTEVKRGRLNREEALVAKQAIYLFCFDEHIEIPNNSSIPDQLIVYL